MGFSIEEAARKARHASRQVAKLSAEQKNQLLRDIAARMLEQTAQILVANEQDLAAARANNLDAAMLDRLKLSPQRIQDIGDAVLEIAAQPDPVGNVANIQRMPS
ncbi:MAG: glutamate-5-semialdehyde dehydrogenase, partial [Paraglaciecola sp.]